MTNQFGATSWDIDTGGGFKKENKKDEYLRLEQGSNVVRLVTKPHEYLVHRFKAHDKDPGYGERVLSSKFYGEDVLEAAPYNLKAKRRWLVGVIDRKTQSYKLLDISKSVFDGIRELVRDAEDWGDPSQYDIDIKVDKQGGATGYYKVIPKSKKPLSAADLEIKQNVDLENLKRKCTPPTVESMKARVAAIIAKSPNAAKSTETVTASVTETAVKSDSSQEDDEFDFPIAGT